MGNHEYCINCESSDFHNESPCDPEKLAKAVARRKEVEECNKKVDAAVQRVCQALVTLGYPAKIGSYGNIVIERWDLLSVRWDLLSVRKDQPTHSELETVLRRWKGAVSAVERDGDDSPETIKELDDSRAALLTLLKQILAGTNDTGEDEEITYGNLPT